MIEILLAILGISFILIVHELGHFFFAKKFGVSVLEFGVGLPPRILKKKIKGTIFSLNLIPMGAFVRLEGEEKIESPCSFLSKPRWQRLAIILGGVSFGWVFSWILIWIIGTFSYIEGFNFPDSLVKERIILEDNVQLQRVKFDFLQSPFQSLFFTSYLTFNLTISLGNTLKHLILKRELPPGVEIEGPVKIVALSKNIISNFGLSKFLYFLSILSLYLSILNLLPIPVVDGGRAFFILSEMLLKKEIPRPILERSILISFLLLFFLFILVTIYDIKELI